MPLVPGTKGIHNYAQREQSWDVCSLTSAPVSMAAGGTGLWFVERTSCEEFDELPGMGTAPCTGRRIVSRLPDGASPDVSTFSMCSWFVQGVDRPTLFDTLVRHLSESASCCHFSSVVA